MFQALTAKKKTNYTADKNEFDILVQNLYRQDSSNEYLKGFIKKAESVTYTRYWKFKMNIVYTILKIIP